MRNGSQMLAVSLYHGWSFDKLMYGMVQKLLTLSLFVFLFTLPWRLVFAQTNTTSTQITSICQFAGSQAGACNSCMNGGNATWTAFGCIQTDPQQFLGEILRIGISIGGGIAFLLILFGGFQIMTSAGNPEQLAAGQEVVSSAITGLLLIIFSIFLLRLIGYNIFAIPGFG